jgi:hypothetical protein
MTPASSGCGIEEAVSSLTSNQCATAATTGDGSTLVATPAAGATSVPMLCDVEDVAVGSPDENPAYAPWFGGQRVHDLVPKSLRLLERSLYVVDLDRDDRVFPVCNR